MKKIPTIFVRDEATGLRYVSREPHPDCGWVFAGEGTATRKYDGTCVMFDGESWWARREVKPDKTFPAGWQQVDYDSVTGKSVGWEPIEQSAFFKYFTEATTSRPGMHLIRTADTPSGWPIGTYELLGPKVNGNPEDFPDHRLQLHAWADELEAPRDFDGLAALMRTFPHEGIVWHHSDGRMAKIKRRDFPKGDQDSG